MNKRPGETFFACETNFIRPIQAILFILSRILSAARRNFATEPRVTVIESKVETALLKNRHELEGTNVVVLDPPRSGAGAKVLDAVIDLQPRVIIYVACDPASLARDSRHLLDKGFQISLRAFDLFPMTHHIECVARFIRES